MRLSPKKEYGVYALAVRNHYNQIMKEKTDSTIGEIR